MPELRAFVPRAFGRQLEPPPIRLRLLHAALGEDAKMVTVQSENGGKANAYSQVDLLYQITLKREIEKKMTRVGFEPTPPGEITT